MLPTAHKMVVVEHENNNYIVFCSEDDVPIVGMEWMDFLKEFKTLKLSPDFYERDEDIDVMGFPFTMISRKEDKNVW